MADESEEFISAAEAIRRVSEAVGRHQARHAICSRAHAGLIEAKAARFVADGRTFDNASVPKKFWWAEGHEALDQDWLTGDFSTWIDHSLHLQAFGVSFSRLGIEALIAPAMASRDTPSGPPARPGGRPPAEWWDDLWVEMCRQLYAGDLQPKKQADIERAMMDWAARHGHDTGISTIRPRARKLWTALKKEDEN